MAADKRIRYRGNEVEITACVHISVHTVHAVKKLTFYGRTTPTATGVRRLRLRAYDAYGYGRATLTATGVSRLQLRACYSLRLTMGLRPGVS